LTITRTSWTITHTLSFTSSEHTLKIIVERCIDSENWTSSEYDITNTTANINISPEWEKNVLVIYDSEHSSSATTDSEGNAVLDTTSFNYEIQIEVTNEKGYLVPDINVSYSQQDGKAELTLTDSSGVHAPAYLFVDLAQAVLANESIISNSLEQSERLLISGTILIIGGVLAFYTGWETGGALYNTFEFVAEHLKESDLTHSTIQCTVAEFAEIIPDALTVAKLPLSTASNVSHVVSGGATLKLHKAIEMGAEFTAEQITNRLIVYLCHETGELIGPNTVIDITFYYFEFLVNGAAGAVSIDVVDVGSSYQGEGILLLSVSPSDPDPYENATLTATLKPAEENIEVTLDLDGTDDYTQDETKTTDNNGVVTFSTIPGGAAQVVDTAIVTVSSKGLSETIIWMY